MASPEVAKNTHFGLGTTGAPTTETDISTYIDNISFPRETEEVETTAFKNSGNRTFLPGLKGATISVSGNWEPTIDTHLEGILDGQDSVNFEFGPKGSTSGYPLYSGTCFVTNYTVDANVGEKNTFSLELRVDSAVTLGTF